MQDAPLGVKLLYKMASETYGNVHVYPVKAQYQFLTDDTVVSMFEGKGVKGKNFCLVSH